MSRREERRAARAARREGRAFYGIGIGLRSGGDGGGGAPIHPRSALRAALPRLVLGIGVAAVGVIFTLDNLGMVEAERWLRYWPALLVAFGLGQLVSAVSPSERFGGGLWTAVGCWLLLEKLHLLRVSLWDLWPLVLVGVGASLVMRAVRPGRARAGEEGSTLHAFAVMSGVTRKSASPAFEGGSMTAIMGGVEADLRGARIATGEAIVDTFAFWGGIEITVPPGWTVEGRVWPLMGGFEDKTTPPAPEDATGRLVVTGAAIMGGVSIKN